MAITLRQRLALEYELKHGDRTRSLLELSAAVGLSKGQVYHELEKTVGLGRDWSKYDAEKAHVAADRRQKKAELSADGTNYKTPSFKEQTAPGFVRRKPVSVKQCIGKTPELTEGVANSVWKRLTETIRALRVQA